MSATELPPPGVTLGEQTYLALRSAIGSGELEPGEKVTERGLAARLGTSPTPVREAMRRLENDGLLERLGPRTTVVAQVGADSLREMTEVEVALRGLAARFAARHATPDDLDVLDRLLDEADDLLLLLRSRAGQGRDVGEYVDRILDVLGEFNQRVNAAARNPVLLRLLDQTRSFSPEIRRAVVRRRVQGGDDFGADRYAGHRDLVAALRARDAARAERIVTDDTARALLDLRTWRD
ncbi:DNA-binding GntR family transcriptional regulator [Nocardioides zeae]|uniref:DNA-binding GntR family transcriptional regulator n=1 Tax=Nocardioides zeae TaxID=1457234 RepID=A0ACC6IGX5_9ACTN|nr:GntR family transcriptional regulator [Nocardioides zeae]MDR6173028.1 DNA-binding GntR family transcriptional regulator [Nocardioides zeae]MDR6210021.1 DNA-binding GntR family transcriptional regulator [Nocardioides zeae]